MRPALSLKYEILQRGRDKVAAMARVGCEVWERVVDR